MRFAGLLLAILVTVVPAGAQDFLNCRFAPGWEQSGAMRSYTADNLFEYKDGGAEGYLSFGFARMTGIDCKSGADTLTIDVSEMTGADGAYGMFSANSDPGVPVASIGMGGQIQRQSSSFAKGKYYVEIAEAAVDTSRDDSATMKAFATAMAERLAGRSTPPDALAWFPGEGLVSTRVVPESVLGLRQLKRGYVAKYTQGQAFIVPEDSPESAAAAMKSLRERFASAAPAQVGDEGFQVKAKYLDGLCIFRKGRYLAGYANLPEAVDAATLAAKLAARIP